MHTDGLCVRAGVEDHLRLSHEAAVHEHPLSVHRTERGHGAHFVIRVQHRYLVLARQAQHVGVGEPAELFEIRYMVCLQHRLHRLVVRDADDDFGPASLQSVRHRRLFQRRVGRDMPEAGIRDPLAPQQLHDR